MVLVDVGRHVAGDVAGFLDPREEELFFVAVVLVDEHEQGVDEGREVGDVLGEVDVRRLQVDGVEHAHDVAVDDGHFVGEAGGAVFGWFDLRVGWVISLGSSLGGRM